MELGCPFVQVFQVQLARAGFEHADDIPPLTVRDFATHAIPFELRENSIFRAGEFRADFRTVAGAG